MKVFVAQVDELHHFPHLGVFEDALLVEDRDRVLLGCAIEHDVEVDVHDRIHHIIFVRQLLAALGVLAVHVAHIEVKANFGNTVFSELLR